MNFLKEAIAGEMLSQRDEAMELPLLLKEETERTPTDATTQTLLDEAARMFRHGCQMAIARFLDRMCLVLRGFWSMAPLRYAAKFDPFLSLDCAPTPSTPAQYKERKGSNFDICIWQHWVEL